MPKKVNCIIDGNLCECKIVESLGRQSNGYYMRIVEFEGKEYAVRKEGSVWKENKPIVIVSGGYKGQ